MFQWYRLIVQGGVAAGLALLLAGGAHAEDITLTTYLPSPRSVTQELRVQHNAALATRGGALLAGTSVLSSLPLVPLGTSPPKLVVVGGHFNPHPVTQLCEAQRAWYNEDGDPNVDLGECRPTALLADGDGRVSVGRHTTANRLHRVQVLAFQRTGVPRTGVPRTGAPNADGALALEPTALDRGIDLSFLRASDGVPLAQLGLAGALNHYAPGSRAGDLVLRVNAGHDLHLATNRSLAGLEALVAPVRLTVKNTGHVGVGTTSPAAHLDVRGLVRPGTHADEDEAKATAPGGVPADGSLYFDTTDQQFMGLHNGAWKPLGGGGGLYSESKRAEVFGGLRTVGKTDSAGACSYLQVNSDATAIQHWTCGGSLLGQGLIYTGCDSDKWFYDCGSTPLPPGATDRFCVGWAGAGRLQQYLYWTLPGTGGWGSTILGCKLVDFYVWE
jgi:hypothetical protein